MLGLSPWTVGVGANLAIAGAYLSICWLILRGLVRTGQLRSNRLASATALIFLTCAVHHGGDAVHALSPLWLSSDVAGRAARAAYTWQMDVWDIFGAGVALLYLSIRSSFGMLLETPAMFTDITRERLQATVAAERTALAEAQALAKMGSWRLSVDGERVMQASDEYVRLFGATREEVLAGEQVNRIHPEDFDRVTTARNLLLSGEAAEMDETFRVLIPGRATVVLHALGRLEHDEDGRVWAAGTVQDITALENARRDHARAEERFRVAFEFGGVATAVIGLVGPDRGRLLNLNAAYAELLGVDLADACGARLDTWVHPDDLELALQAPLGRLAGGDATRQQYERRILRDGQTISTLITDALISTSGEAPVVIEQALDISERKRFESELQHLADHDTLTGLFNRRRFEQELERALAHTRRYGTGGAVLTLDLDGFKFVNDSLGHAAGDALVARLAATLSRSLRETDVVARTGGDEFAIILPGAKEAEACVVAEKLLADLRAGGTVVQGEQYAQVTMSVGITLFNATDTLTGEDLLVEADIAMYDAKGAGKDRMAVFQRGHQRRERIVARQGWLARLRRVVEDDRLVLWAQPVVPVCSGGVPRFELLLRMIGDDGDLIPPSAFLDNAERFGFIEQIDAWVLEQAVGLLEAHHRVPGRELSLSVNVSAKTLNTGRLPALLEDLLSRHEVPVGRLVLEITETAAIANIDVARDFAREVRRLGAQVALDDFGAGFATFYYLKHLHFDLIKIDGEFIRNLPQNRADQLVVSSVVDIARGLGADTVAEFVQDDDTMEMLENFGVGYAQGYHTGRPAPVADILPAFAAVS